MKLVLRKSGTEGGYIMSAMNKYVLGIGKGHSSNYESLLNGMKNNLNSGLIKPYKSAAVAWLQGRL